MSKKKVPIETTRRIESLDAFLESVTRETDSFSDVEDSLILAFDPSLTATGVCASIPVTKNLDYLQERIKIFQIAQQISAKDERQFAIKLAEVFYDDNDPSVGKIAAIHSLFRNSAFYIQNGRLHCSSVMKHVDKWSIGYEKFDAIRQFANTFSNQFGDFINDFLFDPIYLNQVKLDDYFGKSSMKKLKSVLLENEKLDRLYLDAHMYGFAEVGFPGELPGKYVQIENTVVGSMFRGAISVAAAEHIIGTTLICEDKELIVVFETTPPAMKRFCEMVVGYTEEQRSEAVAIAKNKWQAIALAKDLPFYSSERSADRADAYAHHEMCLRSARLFRTLNSSDAFTESSDESDTYKQFNDICASLQLDTGYVMNSLLQSMTVYGKQIDR